MRFESCAGALALACVAVGGLHPGAAGASAVCEGEVVVEQSRNLRVITVTGDDLGNCFEVSEAGGDLTVTGLFGTTVVGSPRPLDGVTKIRISGRDAVDAITVLALDRPDVELQVKADDADGNDITLEAVSVRKLKADAGRGGGDQITADGVVVSARSSINGGKGSFDRFVLGASFLTGPVDLKGFEEMSQP